MASGAFCGVMITMSLIMPITLLILLVVGIPKIEIQKNIDEIWVRKGGEFYKDKEYVKDNAIGKSTSGRSLMLTQARLRNGGNILTAENLLRVRQRLKEVVNTKVTKFGTTFDWDDICYNIFSQYNMPCL
jgi:hypothetical protein